MTDERRFQRINAGVNFEERVKAAMKLLDRVLEVHRRKNAAYRLHYGATGCGIEYAIRDLKAALDILNEEASFDERSEEEAENFENGEDDQ